MKGGMQPSPLSEYPGTPEERRETMPQIIVTAGSTDDLDGSTVLLRERVNITDFESDRFAANLLERLGWAVEDAAVAEKREVVARRDGRTQERRRAPKVVRDGALEPVGTA
jgi:hypothetical protein